MNIEKLRLKKFKRFTDLEIDLSSCPAPPKLVLLMGANGTGKSSIFDAFEYISAPQKGKTNHDDAYFTKTSGNTRSVSIALGGGIDLTRSNRQRTVTSPSSWNGKSAFYGRSSFRTVPELRPQHRAPSIWLPTRIALSGLSSTIFVSILTSRRLPRPSSAKSGEGISARRPCVHASLIRSTTVWREFLESTIRLPCVWFT